MVGLYNGVISCYSWKHTLCASNIVGVQHSRGSFFPPSPSFYFFRHLMGPQVTLTSPLAPPLPPPHAWSQSTESRKCHSGHHPFSAHRYFLSVETFPLWSVFSEPWGEELSSAEVESQFSIWLHWMNYGLEFQLQVLFCYTPGLCVGLPQAQQASLTGPWPEHRGWEDALMDLACSLHTM